MNLTYLNHYLNIKNDNLEDKAPLAWSLHMTKDQMLFNRYTKRASIKKGRFRFDIEYFSHDKSFFVHCRMNNNNREHRKGCDRTNTIHLLRIYGTTNEVLIEGINKWIDEFLNEIKQLYLI